MYAAARAGQADQIGDLSHPERATAIPRQGELAASSAAAGRRRRRLATSAARARDPNFSRRSPTSEVASPSRRSPAASSADRHAPLEWIFAPRAGQKPPTRAGTRPRWPGSACASTSGKDTFLAPARPLLAAATCSTRSDGRPLRRWRGRLQLRRRPGQEDHHSSSPPKCATCSESSIADVLKHRGRLFRSAIVVRGTFPSPVPPFNVASRSGHRPTARRDWRGGATTPSSSTGQRWSTCWREVWPRLSIDEKKLFDVTRTRPSRRGHAGFFATARPPPRSTPKAYCSRRPAGSPFEPGWRAASEMRSPPTRRATVGNVVAREGDGGTARLRDPSVGTGVYTAARCATAKARLNSKADADRAWRFVDDEVLRDRLKEAKGIGTPATRAEIIGGLKKQEFPLPPRAARTSSPPKPGLKLFGVLKRCGSGAGRPGRDGAALNASSTMSSPATEDGGRQSMSQDAMHRCRPATTASQTQGPVAGGPSSAWCPRNGGSERPPTPAMKLCGEPARQKLIDLQLLTRRGACRAFLQHAAETCKRPGCRSFVTAGSPTLASPTKPSACETTPHRRDTRRARSDAGRLERASPPTCRSTRRAIAPGKMLTATTTSIPYGNKDVALKLGARYSAAGWYEQIRN